MKCYFCSANDIPEYQDILICFRCSQNKKYAKIFEILPKYVFALSKIIERNENRSIEYCETRIYLADKKLRSEFKKINKKYDCKNISVFLKKVSYQVSSDKDFLERKVNSSYDNMSLRSLTLKQKKFIKFKYGGIRSFIKIRNELFESQWVNKLRTLRQQKGSRLSLSYIKQNEPRLGCKVSKIGMRFINEHENVWSSTSTEEFLKNLAAKTKYQSSHKSKNNIFLVCKIQEKMEKEADDRKKEEVKERIIKEYFKYRYSDIFRETGIKLEDHFQLVRYVIDKKFSFCSASPELQEEAFLSGCEAISECLLTYRKEKAMWSTYAWNAITARIRRNFENYHPFIPLKIPSARHYKDGFNIASHFGDSVERIVDAKDKGILSFEDIKLDDNIFIQNIKELVSSKYGNEVSDKFIHHVFFGEPWVENNRSEKGLVEGIKKYVKGKLYHR